MAIRIAMFRMESSFAPVRVLFSPFDGTKILLPFAQKTFGFYKLTGDNTFFGAFSLVLSA